MELGERDPSLRRPAGQSGTAVEAPQVVLGDGVRAADLLRSAAVGMHAPDAVELESAAKLALVGDPLAIGAPGRAQLVVDERPRGQGDDAVGPGEEVEHRKTAERRGRAEVRVGVGHRDRKHDPAPVRRELAPDDEAAGAVLLPGSGVVGAHGEGELRVGAVELHGPQLHGQPLGRSGGDAAGDERPVAVERAEGVLLEADGRAGHGGGRRCDRRSGRRRRDAGRRDQRQEHRQGAHHHPARSCRRRGHPSTRTSSGCSPSRSTRNARPSGRPLTTSTSRSSS